MCVETPCINGCAYSYTFGLSCENIYHFHQSVDALEARAPFSFILKALALSAGRAQSRDLAMCAVQVNKPVSMGQVWRYGASGLWRKSICG